MNTIAVQAVDAFEDISPLIGSRVHLKKDDLLSGEYGDTLRDLLEQRGVLVFPKIDFSDEEQVIFTKTIGEFMPELAGQKVYNISLDKDKNPNRDYLKGSLFWHVDGTMNRKPIGAAVLSSKVLPTWGGNTEFCNTYAAYEALSEEQKREIEGFRVVHSMLVSQLYHTPEPSREQLESWKALGEAELPLVWNHRSGRKSLILGNTAHYVKGLDPMESTVLLHSLRDWATQPQFVYSHEWSEGDAVMWDNTGTMHRAMPYDPDCGRLLHRTKTAGEEAFE
jgi:alpha-ketoglutarate-dependent taurine dioxygenase